jgi:hypothetical protein
MAARMSDEERGAHVYELDRPAYLAEVALWLLAGAISGGTLVLMLVCTC